VSSSHPSHTHTRTHSFAHCGFPPLQVSVSPLRSRVYVVDFGQNMAGQMATRVVCPAGPVTLTFIFGESLHPDGSVLNQYGDFMRANYTCAGTGDTEQYTTLFRCAYVPVCASTASGGHRTHPPQRAAMPNACTAVGCLALRPAQLLRLPLRASV
jgi:hypothetical protein